MPAVGLGDASGGSTLLAGRPSRGSEAAAHTLSRTQGEGVSTGEGGPSRVLFFIGASTKEGEPGELRRHKTGGPPVY